MSENRNVKSGRWVASTIAARKEVNELCRRARDTIAKIAPDPRRPSSSRTGVGRKSSSRAAQTRESPPSAILAGRQPLGANAPPEPRPFSLRGSRDRRCAMRRRSCPPLQPFPQALPGCPAATGLDPSDEPPPPGFSALFQRSIFGYRLFGFCSLSGQFGELSISFS